MIDIHTHILQDCDDGSPDLETSLKFLKISEENGITDIILTPHFMLNQYHNTSAILNPLYEKLNSAKNENNININLYLAAEVYLTNKIYEHIEKEDLTISNTKYLLIETALRSFPENLLEILFNLVRKGYHPILAHPERYSPVMKDISLAEDLMRRDILLQLNAGSFLGNYGKQVQKTAWKLLDKGFVHFIASDNHCNTDFYPLPEACRQIEEKYDTYTVDLLTNLNPQRLLNNEKIEIFYLEKNELEEENMLNKIIGKFTKFII